MGIDTSNRRNYNLQTTRCRPLSAMPPVTPLTSYYPHAGRLASAGFGADASPSKTYVTASKRSVYTAGSTKPRSTATTKPWQNATKNCYSKSNFCPLFSITPQPQQHYNQQKIVESFQTDMKDVPQWLKSLRLHKYTALFQTMSYAEMMALDEAQLERRDVTQGARRKIMQSIKRLHDRPRALFELNTRMHSDANVETVCDAINELCVILNTPIPAVSTATASSLPVYILRVLDQIHNLLFKSTMAENTRSQRNILPEIEDEYVVRLMQICEKILAHEAFEINAKQQIASYRSTLRRYIQNYGIRSNIVQNSFEYKTSAPRSSRHYHKSALSHPHSSCCKRTVALCDTTATSELTNSKVDSYRRVNSEIAACAQIPLFDDCTQSTNSVNTITNDGNFESRRSCVAGDDVQRSLGMLNETQKANLCNWMLLLRDYPAKQPSVTEPDTVSTNQLIVNLIQSTIQSEVVAEQPAIESVDVEPSTAYFSGVTASRIAPKRCCAPVTPFNTISKEFDAWLPFSEDTIPSSNNDAAQFRSDFYEQPAIISQNIPTNTAPTSTSTTLIGYADRFFSFSYSSSSDPSSSDRSSGAGSPMVYNFFEDELPPTDLIDKRPSPRISTYGDNVPRNALAVCSGYGSADDAFDNHNAYEQQQQNMFSMLLLRQMQQQQVQQQQYKLFS